MVLAQDGFQDAENTAVLSRPLKTWSGLSIRVSSENDESIDIIDLVASQPPHEPLHAPILESPVSNQERFLYHPGFERLCQGLCQHGNHTLRPHHVKAIWLYRIEGKSNRVIGELLGINDTLVWRTLNTLTQWMNLMDLDEELAPESLAKVVLRDFNRKADEALIYASWRNALWYDDENRKEGEADRFFRHATTSIRNILDNPKTKVRIACLADGSDFIVGYSVITGNCLQFVYVKIDYRNKRIASLLVPKAVESCSPIMTKLGRAIAIKKNWIKENQNGKAEGIEE